MGRVQNSVRIDRPISEVFAYVVDPSNTPRWNSTVLASTSSDASVRVGTTIRSRVRFLFREREIEAKVIALEPHSRLVTESLQPYRYTLTWTFAPEDGGTRVTRTGNIEFRGILRVISPLVIRPIARRTDQASLERMKAELERRGRSLD